MPIRPSVAWPCATPTAGCSSWPSAAPALGELPHAVAHRDGESHGARGGIRAGHGVVEEGGQPPVAGEAVDRRLEPVQQLAGAAVVLAQHGHDVLGLDALRERDEAPQPARDDGDLAPVALEEGLVPRGHEQLRDLRREEPAQLRDPLLEPLVEALELGGLRLHRVVVALDAQQRPDARQQLRRHERLGHEVVGARFERARLLLLAARRHHHDGHEAGGRLGAQRAADRVAVQARHHDVEQDEVDAALRDPRERRLARARRRRGVAARFEHRLQEAQVLRHVVDEQDRRFRRHPPASRPAISAATHLGRSRTLTGFST